MTGSDVEQGPKPASVAVQYTSRARTLDEALGTGRRLLDKRAYDRSAHCFSLIAARWPLDKRVQNGLAQSYKGLGDDDAMVRSFRRATICEPEIWQSYFNHGNGLRAIDDPEGALSHYDRSAILAPGVTEILVGRSLALLQAGHWSKAWNDYEKRESCREFEGRVKASGLAVWDGRLDAGLRVLLVTEQGAGDAIQFVRYAIPMSRAGLEVYVRCPLSLETLFRDVSGVRGVVGPRFNDFDAICLMMSLPHRFATTPDTIPFDGPYLVAPPASSALPDTGRPRVGLAWQGNPNNPRDASRSSSLASIAELFEITGVDFYSLQYGWREPAPDDPPKSRLMTPLILGDVDDFAETASRINQMDLVVCVDTAVAHIAGALGKPTLLMLSRDADWRWLVESGPSPWYPSVHVHRQAKRGDWTSVVDACRAAVLDLRDRPGGGSGLP